MQKYLGCPDIDDEVLYLVYFDSDVSKAGLTTVNSFEVNWTCTITEPYCGGFGEINEYAYKNRFYFLKGWIDKISSDNSQIFCEFYIGDELIAMQYETGQYAESWYQTPLSEDIAELLAKQEMTLNADYEDFDRARKDFILRNSQ